MILFSNCKKGLKANSACFRSKPLPVFSIVCESFNLKPFCCRNYNQDTDEEEDEEESEEEDSEEDEEDEEENDYKAMGHSCE